MKKLLDLAWNFLWISTVTLGGGMAMLPLMERAFVERRQWLTEREMVDIVAVMQSLPGLIAINMAVLIGFRVKGVPGALVSAVAVVLVPFFVILAISVGCSHWLDAPATGHVFLGIRAGTAALILLSLEKLAKKVMTDRLAWVLGVAAFAAAVVLRVDVTWVIGFGFAVGLGLVVLRVLRREK